MKPKNRGFTLIELLAVIVVLGIILVIAIPKVVETINSARISSFENQKKIMLRVARDYIQINGDDDGVNDGILSYGYLIEKNKLKKGIKDENDKVLNEEGTLIDTTNNKVRLLGEELTENQNILSSNYYGFPLSDYRIYGNSTQEPDPTLSSPKEVISLGENPRSFDVITMGKNLFDISTQFNKNGFVITGNQYSTTYNYAVDSNIQCLSNDIMLESGTYTLSFDMKITSGLNMSPFISVWDNNTNTAIYKITSGTMIQDEYQKFTIPFSLTNKTSISFRAHSYGSKSEIQTSTVKNIQLEKGTTVTDYEPYKEIITPIDLSGHEPLRKIGDVVDYIDYKNGKLVRRIGKKVFDGTESWDYEEPTKLYWISISGRERTRNCLMKCTHFSIEYDWIPIIGKFRSGYNINTMFQYDDGIGGIENFKSWLSTQYANGTPVTVYYQLAEPDDKETIDNLPQIPTYNGINNIKVSGGGSISAITYKN